MILTDDGGEPPLSSFSVQHYGQTTAHGTVGYSTSFGLSSNSTVPVIAHVARNTSYSAPSISSSTSSAVSLSSGVSVSSGLIGRMTRVSSMSFGGGGGVYSGVVGNSAGAGSSVASGGGGVVAMAVPAPIRFGSSSFSKNPLLEDAGTGMGVYNGDNPGVITGEENLVSDNPIVTSYGQPIGDGVWVLLLMVVGYAVWIGKRAVRDRSQDGCR